MFEPSLFPQPLKAPLLPCSMILLLLVMTTPTDTPINETSKSSEKKTKADKSTVKMKSIKVNLTSIVTQLDLSDPTEKQTDFSKTK